MPGEVNAKDLMYINEECQIDDYDNLPRILKNDMIEMQAYYEQDDWVGFDCCLEAFEATVKQCKLSGRITDKQFDQLFAKYGLYGS